MRRLLLTSTAIMTIAGSGLHAGGLAEPVMEPEVVAANTSSSSAGVLVPLLLLLVIVAAAASSGGGGGGEVSASDLRLKHDLRPVGVAENGLSIYRFRYKGMDGQFEGVMAQDVAERFPEAIVPMPGGYMAVDYAKIGIKMKTLH